MNNGTRVAESRPVLPHTFDQLITSCFFLVMFASACLMPMQNDTWWHLRAGQEMWGRRVLLFADEWSFTAAGAHWPNHEWLSELIFYLLYRIAGLPGLTFFAASCITIGLALSWRLMAGTAMQRLLFLGVAMASISPVWTVRPHVFTFVLVMAVLHLALHGRYWPIPFIFIPWANLHGGVALGIVVLGGALAGVVALALWAERRGADTRRPGGHEDTDRTPGDQENTNRRSGDQEDLNRSGYRTTPLKPLAIVLVASFLATWVTPLGPSLWWEIPVSIQRSAANRIVEWRAPSLFEPAHLAFWAAAALLIATTWLQRRFVRSNNHAALIAMALAILPLAIRSRRNVPPFLLVAMPALTHNLAGWLATWKEDRRTEKPRANAAAFVLCAAACTAVIAVAWSRPAARLQWQPIPETIAAAAEACGDRVYNRYEDGGPLIWFAPGVRVFIDSRQDPYPVPFVQEYIRMEETGQYKEAFERYQIRCAVLTESSRVARQLLQDGWSVMVREGEWMVISRQSPVGSRQSPIRDSAFSTQHSALRVPAVIVPTRPGGEEGVWPPLRPAVPGSPRPRR